MRITKEVAISAAGILSLFGASFGITTLITQDPAKPPTAIHQTAAPNPGSSTEALQPPLGAGNNPVGTSGQAQPVKPTQGKAESTKAASSSVSRASETPSSNTKPETTPSPQTTPSIPIVSPTTPVTTDTPQAVYTFFVQSGEHCEGDLRVIEGTQYYSHYDDYNPANAFKHEPFTRAGTC